MAIEYSARVARIPTYPAAKGYALPEDVALMASNESPDPPLPEVVAAVTRVLGGLNRYPDPANRALRAALSDRFGVPAGRIAIGNGSCDILLATGEALLEPGAELVYGWPSFSVYPQLEAASGATGIRVGLNDRHEHDLPAMLAEITAATRLVVVCNPNNPTSTAIGLEEIAAFVAQVPKHVAVLLDEAYCEFNVLDDPDASVDLLAKHANLVLLRTFSKIYGLCGLRVGYALCGDERFVQAVLARGELELGLGELGIQPAASQANFCWFDLPDEVVEADVVGGLAQRGVLVRAGTALGREGALRVTYGTPQQNDRFLRELRALLPR